MGLVASHYICMGQFSEVTAMSHSHLAISTILSASIHEIKNEINSMIMRLESLYGKYPEGSSDITLLKEDASNISTELVRLLALYKLNEKELKPQISQYGVDDFLEEKASQHKATGGVKNIAIDYQCDENIAAFFDENLLSCIIDTAIHNAFRFANHKIMLNAHKEPPYTVISVEDDGCGFPEQVLQQHDFSQPYDGETENTGLGIYFAAQIAAAHCSKEVVGKISLDNKSTLGGARFSVFLP